MRELKGLWALILGASSGMGRATARALAAEGMHVVGVHFDPPSAQAATDQLVQELRAGGTCAHFAHANAAAARTRGQLVPWVADLTGGAGVHVLLHSLAFGSLAPYLGGGDGAPEAVTERQLTMTSNVMAHSLVLWVQDLHAAGLLPRGAKVYAMTSAGSSRAVAHYGPVSAAKSALESHVRQLALELAPHGVAVNALRAGVTLTPAFQRIPGSEEFARRARTLNPHGRLTVPEDVAEAVVVLARTDSAWITGNTIGVDGGELISG
nr:SDR family oxidoreductase [Streptomyces cupreus]